MRATLLRIAILVALTGVWVLLWGNYSAANAVSGLAVALAITLLLPMPPVPVQGRVHPLSVLRLVVRVAWYLVVSSVQVSWLAIKPGPAPPSGVLRAEVSIKSDLVLVFAVNILTMIPGSIVLEIDQLRRVLYCHVIDVGSGVAVDRFYRQVAEVERLVVAAYERDEDWQPAEEAA
ncbi:Na+/H+ antiporter subunit E [Mycobacterium celatum]|uniref:Cation:proton antiporter n=1 Tax=Mycobacterium celatum TaxID=28045 RepID=A0A1X1RX59_MYCCE|nr:Na+/H+ antiporter subunit E [Mycobacterium celatum]ORV19628.1 cation:proton antiporter [Mycobacterium celatum]PIB79958.1 Na+/H+ antiporter subunit E [Mycobacterium celatum]